MRLSSHFVTQFSTNKDELNKADNKLVKIIHKFQKKDSNHNVKDANHTSIGSKKSQNIKNLSVE